MARITVEDCMENEDIRDRFELVVLASERAKNIIKGSQITVEGGSDKKYPVVTLEEFAAKKLNIKSLKESVIQNHMETTTSSRYDVISRDSDNEVVESIEEEMEEGKVVDSFSNMFASEELDIDD